MKPNMLSHTYITAALRRRCIGELLSWGFEAEAPSTFDRPPQRIQWRYWTSQEHAGVYTHEHAVYEVVKCAPNRWCAWAQGWNDCITGERIVEIVHDHQDIRPEC